MKHPVALCLSAALIVAPIVTLGGCSSTPPTAIEGATRQAPLASGDRRVSTPAGSLRVRETGRGTTALLLWHALYADPSMFEALIDRLSPDYRMLVVSAPGHAGSGLPAGPLTSALAGSAVLAVLDAHGIDRAAVVGCSWGSIAGLQAALQSPERITAVAAFNTPFGQGTADLSTRAIVWMTGWLGDTAFFGRRVASGFFAQSIKERQPAVVDRFVAAFPGRDTRALQSAARAVLLERESLLPQLARLRVPVVVVAGAEDPLYPAAEAQAIARDIPGARFVLAADSAHLTPLEQPALAETLVRELVPPSPRDRSGRSR